jgi:hypothetical protein
VDTWALGANSSGGPGGAYGLDAFLARGYCLVGGNMFYGWPELTAAVPGYAPAAPAFPRLPSPTASPQRMGALAAAYRGVSAAAAAVAAAEAGDALFSPALTAPASDPRNGLLLHYILATHQEGATNPVTGAAYPAGAILGGNLNWSNVDSSGAGYAYQEPVSNQFYSVTADTKWSSWLTTQVAGGYDSYTDRRINPGFTFFAPNSGANTTANWAAGAGSA